MSMKTLILSCNTGQGHNSCARALREVYQAHGDVCEIKDALAYVATWVSKCISNGHVYIYRHFPGAFRVGYTCSEKHPALFDRHSGVYRLLALGAERLYADIQADHYDSVLCTHVFSAMMMTELLRRHPLTLPTGFVATDYTCSPGVADTALQQYFIPHHSLCSEFAAHGLPAGRLVGSGIPIRQDMYIHTPADEAKQAVGIDPTHRHLLIMCGSMGCGPLVDITGQLAAALPPQCDVTVICGNNETLRAQLNKIYAHHPAIHIRGYVSDMPHLMDSADLYLTKPGGISVTEAAAKRLPMVFIDAVAGCEEYNMHFFLRTGGAVSGRTAEDVASRCLTLLRHPDELAHMKAALCRLDLPNGAQTIYTHMTATAVLAAP